MIRSYTNVRVRADRKLLRPAEPEWQLGVKYERVIREKFIPEPVVEGQPIEIVFAAENEIVELRQEIIQSCLQIQVTEIESGIIDVVKDLLSRPEMPVVRFRGLRIILRPPHL